MGVAIIRLTVCRCQVLLDFIPHSMRTFDFDNHGSLGSEIQLKIDQVDLDRFGLTSNHPGRRNIFSPLLRCRKEKVTGSQCFCVRMIRWTPDHSHSRWITQITKEL